MSRMFVVVFIHEPRPNFRSVTEKSWQIMHGVRIFSGSKAFTDPPLPTPHVEPTSGLTPTRSGTLLPNFRTPMVRRQPALPSHFPNL